MMGLDPADVALRDATLAVLRDRPVAHRAVDIQPVLPRRVRLMTGTPSGFCANHHAMLRSVRPEIHLLDCRGSRGHLVSELPTLNVLLHHLAALHALHYIDRFPGPAGGAATWMWIEPGLVPGRHPEAEVARQCEQLLAAAGPWQEAQP